MFQYRQSYQVQSSYYSACKPTKPCLLPSPLDSKDRRTGRVKFYNVKKGYGFIIPNFHSICRSLQQSDSILPTEVFVHHTSIMNANNGYPVGLNKGDEVEYDLRDGPKGIYAMYVTGPNGVPVNAFYFAEYSSMQQEIHAKSLLPSVYQHPYVTYYVPPYHHGQNSIVPYY